jgi:hypothetical protein
MPSLRSRVPYLLTAALLWAALVACGDVAGLSGTFSPSPSGTPTADPSASETPRDGVDYEESNDGYKKNVVQVINKHADKLRLKANIQLNRINGNEVKPLNAAIAVGETCSGCQTIAVALQLDLYAKGANVVAPENYAIALNVKCDHCVTVAHAVQYALPVDDPKQDVKDVRDLINDMQHELNAISGEKGITADQAETRVRAVIARFSALATSLREDVKRTEESDTPSPSPSASPSASPSGSPTPTTPAPAAPASASPTGTPGPSPTP